MGSVRVREETSTLFLDFRIDGRRVREQTELLDTPSNRKKLVKILARVEGEIAQGTFEREALAWELSGKRKSATDQKCLAIAVDTRAFEANAAPMTANAATVFEKFAQQWFVETEVLWRRSYRITQRGALDKYLAPRFGQMPLGQITKADILAFRSGLTKLKGRKGETLSNRRTNAIMKPLRQIMNEAAQRFNFPSPFLHIKPLKTNRPDVMPFTLQEVQRILASVRTDFRAYLTFRFFTGLRSGEVHGLKWKNVDFEQRLIFVREALVLGADDDLKTDGSQRDVYMSQVVVDALQKVHASRASSEYVFTNTVGGPLDNKNFVNRVWNPLLDRLGLQRRRPYQMRHTAATLWLASGEAPEWIARQLGHTTTEMLFRVYSRYVPNLTRQDGSAMDRLLSSKFQSAETGPAEDTDAPGSTEPHE
jgi:integrase